MNPDPALSPRPVSVFGAELTRSLVFALVWSSEISARFGEASVSGRLSVLVAALGCTALTLGALGIVVAERRAKASAGSFRVIVAGLLVSGPMALLACVLQGKTHHRALGGVTFALIACTSVAMGALVVRRLLGPSGQRVQGRSGLGSVSLTILVVISISTALGSLVHELGAGGSGPGRWLTQDLAIGVTLSALMVVVPRVRLPSRVASAGAVLWALSVGAGAILVGSNMALRAILSEHAPMALGFAGGL